MIDIAPAGSVLARPALASARVATSYKVLFLVVVALQLLAVWLPTYNALSDFPMHLARIDVLARYDSSPLYRQLFQKSVVPNPNMAIDYLATPLVPLIGMIGAGKVFLSLLVVLFDLGCLLLGRLVQAGSSWTALACAMLVFHGAYQYGFINYSFSIPLLLLWLALWYSQRAHWKMGPLVCHAGLLTALFVSHLAGFACAVLIMVFSWLSERIQERRWNKNIVWEAASLIPAGAILLSLPRGHSVSMERGGVEWSTPTEKLASCLTLFRSGYTALDAVVVLALLAVAVLAVRYRKQHDQVMMRAGLLLFLVFLLMPRRLLMDGSGYDVRFVIPGILLCLLSLRIPKSRAALVVGVAFLGLLGVRLACQVRIFRQASFVTEDVVRLVDRVPSGTEFWMVCEDRRILRRNLHAGAYGIARSGALPSNYLLIPTLRPIWFRQPFQRAEDLPRELTDDLVRSTLQRLPYAVVCGFADSRSRALSPYASEVAASGPCSLWQTR